MSATAHADTAQDAGDVKDHPIFRGSDALRLEASFAKTESNLQAAFLLLSILPWNAAGRAAMTESIEHFKAGFAALRTAIHSNTVKQ